MTNESVINNKIYTLGIVGARGYVGKELLELLLIHPQIHIEWVSSRKSKGQLMSSLLDEKLTIKTSDDCTITSLDATQVAEKTTDIIVLALPNGLAKTYVKAIEKSNNSKVIIDLSADFRFDDNWIYSVPELDHQDLEASRKSSLIKISNPGCYATAMQLAIAPIKHLLSSPAHCFGVSGFSGAGTKPSAFNNAKNLKNNLIGYKLVEHLHEIEVSTRLQQEVSFSPHVAEFFRGINMTVQLNFTEPQTCKGLNQYFQDFYQQYPLVKCQSETPEIKQVINSNYCIIGGITVSTDGARATVISCIDNLLKGAASQALQNINIALGLDPYLAISQSHSKTHLNISGEH
jgi:N-acetyl-gamma-glutamyl-phosphate reductase